MTGASVPTDRPRQKAAATVAAAIEREIITGRYAIGASLGTEAELCARYGVSRWALREAIAIVQHDGLIYVRRGRGGGAVVNAAPERSLAAAICGFLLYTNMSNEQLIDARMTIDRALFDLAVRRFDQPLPAAVFDLLEEPDIARDGSAYSSAVLDQVLELGGNPFVTVFGLALSKLMTCRLALYDRDGVTTLGAAMANPLAELRRRQLQAIVGLDSNGAAAALIDMAQRWRELFTVSEKRPKYPFSLPHAKAQARRIAEVLHPDSDIRTSGIVSALLMLEALGDRAGPNGMLGSEATLIERYGVARNTLREGVRILERDGLVRAEAGRTGGIRAGRPDMSLLVERAGQVFEFLRFRLADIDRLAHELRIAAIGLAITRADTADARAALATAVGEQAGQGDAGELFLMLAERTGDSFLILFERICRQLTGRLVRSGPAPDNHMLHKLQAAIRDGHVAVARRIVATIHGDWMARLPEKIS